MFLTLVVFEVVEIAGRFAARLLSRLVVKSVEAGAAAVYTAVRREGGMSLEAVMLPPAPV